MTSSRRTDRTRGRPAAVLWDMDGTLVDTEPYWIECEYELVEAHGGTWSQDHAHAIVGSDLLGVGALHPRTRWRATSRPKRSSTGSSTA